MRTAKKRPALRLVDKPTEPEAAHPQAEPDMLAIALNLVVNVDGKPVANNPVQFAIPRPGPEVGDVTLQVGLDGRALAKMLAPLIAQEAAKAQATKLWVPGMAK